MPRPRRWAGLLLLVGFAVVVLWRSPAPGRQNVTPILGMPWSDDDKTNQALQTIDQCLGGLEINQCGGIGLRAVSFANLGTVVNGGLQYCFDCTAANPCTGSGTGAVSRGEGGAWNCAGGAGGGSSAFNAITTGVNSTATMTCNTGCAMLVSGSGTIAATTAAALASAPATCSANQATTGINTAGAAQGCFQPVLISGVPVGNQLGVWSSATTEQGFPDAVYTNSPPTLSIGATVDGLIQSRCTTSSNTCRADFPDNAGDAAAPGTATTRLYTKAGRLYSIVNGGIGTAFSTAASVDTWTNKRFDTAGVGNNFQVNSRQITALTGNTGTLATGSGAYTPSNCIRSDAAGNFVDAGTTCGGGSTPRLDQVLDPNVNKSFSMGTNTLGFVFGNITGGASETVTMGALTGVPAVSQYVIQDTTANTNTGPLVAIQTVGTSTAIPLQVTSQGASNGIQLTGGAAPVLSPIGTAKLAARWSDLTNPNTSQTLTMGSNATAWTFGGAAGFSALFSAATGGAGTAMFQLSDTTNNTGTGFVTDLFTAAGSTALPVGIFAQGQTNGVFMDTAGVLKPTGAGKLAPRLNDVTNTGAAWVVTDGFGSQINITSGASGSFNLNVSSTNTGAQDKIIDNDFSGNTGTGFLRRINTVGTSTMKPLGVFAQGTTNGVGMDSTAVWRSQGAGQIAVSAGGGNVSLTGQTAVIAPTTIIASAPAGQYQICCYEKVTTVATTSTLPNCRVTFTDGTDSTVITSTVSGTSSGNTVSTTTFACAPFDVANATAIQYSTTGYASSPPATMAYKLTVNVTRLN